MEQTHVATEPEAPGPKSAPEAGAKVNDRKTKPLHLDQQGTPFPWEELGTWFKERTRICDNPAVDWYVNAIWTDCACCFALRSTLIGMAVGIAGAMAVASIF